MSRPPRSNQGRNQRLGCHLFPVSPRLRLLPGILIGTHPVGMHGRPAACALPFRTHRRALSLGSPTLVIIGRFTLRGPDIPSLGDFSTFQDYFSK